MIVIYERQPRFRQQDVDEMVRSFLDAFAAVGASAHFSMPFK